jgi:hypothetical protein
LNNQNRTEPKTIVIAVHLDFQPEEEKKKQLFSRIVGESKLFFWKQYEPRAGRRAESESSERNTERRS